MENTRTTFYVDTNVKIGTNDGLSWETAFPNLPDAIEASKKTQADVSKPSGIRIKLRLDI